MSVRYSSVSGVVDISLAVSRTELRVADSSNVLV